MGEADAAFAAAEVGFRVQQCGYRQPVDLSWRRRIRYRRIRAPHGSKDQPLHGGVAKIIPVRRLDDAEVVSGEHSRIVERGLGRCTSDDPVLLPSEDGERYPAAVSCRHRRRANDISHQAAQSVGDRFVVRPQPSFLRVVEHERPPQAAQQLGAGVRGCQLNHLTDALELQTPSVVQHPHEVPLDDQASHRVPDQDEALVVVSVRGQVRLELVRSRVDGRHPLKKPRPPPAREPDARGVLEPRLNQAHRFREVLVAFDQVSELFPRLVVGPHAVYQNHAQHSRRLSESTVVVGARPRCPTRLLNTTDTGCKVEPGTRTNCTRSGPARDRPGGQSPACTAEDAVLPRGPVRPPTRCAENAADGRRIRRVRASPWGGRTGRH